MTSHGYDTFVSSHINGMIDVYHTYLVLVEDTHQCPRFKILVISVEILLCAPLHV